MNRRTYLTATVLPLLALAALIALIAGCESPTRQHGGCNRPKVVVFSASWCGPCQRDRLVLVQLEGWGVDVQVVDIDRNPELAAEYGVKSVPTYFVYICGRNVQRTQDITVVVSVMRPLFRR